MKFVRLLFLLLLLIAPVILWFGLVNLSHNILQKTPLYEQPLEITHTWVTRNVRRIKGADLEEENIINFPITISGITLNIITEANRAPKGEEEEKEVAGAVSWECSKGLNKKEMVREMLRPAGYERVISVKEGGLSSDGNATSVVSISMISFIAIALYIPIIIAITKLGKKR